ncbi:MAG: hypothetical protein F4X83_08640 [Chloroflexi bacterium]|nr:hypothetical protein [Chloroflexota bacterium]
MGDLGGAIARFEVDQEVAAFVREKKGATPSEADIETLDFVYEVHIRPTLDAMETSFRPLVGELFRSVNSSFSVEYSGGRVGIGGFFESGKWETTKQQYIVKPGFVLSESVPLALTHDYRFVNYTGTGSKDFSMAIAVEWQFGGEGFSRRATVNREPIPSLEYRVLYEELDLSSAEVDRTVAVISQRVLQEIQRLSN